jgi:GAF domain-containing protein
METTAAGFLETALATHGCQTGTIHLLDPATGELALAAQVGLPPHVAGIVARVPIGKGMAGLAAERRQPVQTCNLQTDATGDIRPGARDVPVQASVAVPMLLDGRLCGVIGFARSESHEWSESELARLSATATEAARQSARWLPPRG